MSTYILFEELTVKETPNPNDVWQGAGVYAFRKYISGLLDVITPSKHIVDHLGEEDSTSAWPRSGSDPEQLQFQRMTLSANVVSATCTDVGVRQRLGRIGSRCHRNRC